MMGENFEKSALVHMIDQMQPQDQQKETMWNRIQMQIDGQKAQISGKVPQNQEKESRQAGSCNSGKNEIQQQEQEGESWRARHKQNMRQGMSWKFRGRKAVAAAVAVFCVIGACLLTGVGVNAATGGAFFKTVKEFCGISSQQKKTADEGLSLKSEVYAPELVGCSQKYVVFANERALMVYGRKEEKLLAALDLQAMDCNYFNTDSVHTRVLLQDDVIFIFNEKQGKSPDHMYIYDLKKPGNSDDGDTKLSGTVGVMTASTDRTQINTVYKKWEKIEKTSRLDTFSNMADAAFWNSLGDAEKYDGEKIQYSENCIAWKADDGIWYRSALVVTDGTGYELYTCPADQTEQISTEKLFVQNYAEEMQEETGTENEADTGANGKNAKQNELPAFAYMGDDEIIKMVCEYMITNQEEFGDGTDSENDIYVPEPVIVKTIKDGKDLLVFGNFWSDTYYANGNTLMEDCGGEYPARLRFSPDKNGNYTVTEVQQAEDGSDYESSIRVFCKGYPVDPREIIDSHDAYTAVRKEMLQSYVKANDLVFTYYKDFGWDPVALD